MQIIQRYGGRPDAIIAALRQQLSEGSTEHTGSSTPPPAMSYPAPYYPAPYAPAPNAPPSER